MSPSSLVLERSEKVRLACHTSFFAISVGINRRRTVGLVPLLRLFCLHAQKTTMTLGLFYLHAGAENNILSGQCWTRTE